MPELLGSSQSGWAVWGSTVNGTGVVGTAGTGVGTFGESTDSYGVWGRSTTLSGVVGDTTSSESPGVWGHAMGEGPGVVGTASLGNGVRGESTSGAAAVFGTGPVGPTVIGTGVQGVGEWGVYGVGRRYGVAGLCTNPAIGWGGYFDGGVFSAGTLATTGGGSRIDHPLDPANKYLNHSFVESSEMKNVYDGIVTLEGNGEAWVDLPEWCEARNEDFRYQLTPVGEAAPNLHVGEAISENHFKIAGGEGGMRVCWQVTGSRKDPWAAANPVEVEQEKPQEERGRYLHPNLYNAPEEQSVMRARMGEMREPPQPPQPPPMPPAAPPMPPGVAAPGVDLLQEEHRQQIDELRGEIEELRSARVEDERRRELDDLRRQIEELKRRRK